MAVFVQSLFARHCAHVERWVSQTGVGAEHCELDVQPTRQRKSIGSQTGAEAPQSPFDKHCTQRPPRGVQNGALVGQSELLPHSTHVCVTVLQIAAGCEQSVFDLQPTHAPVVVSQVRLNAGKHCASVVHDGWH